jgi:hypothetical protein
MEAVAIKRVYEHEFYRNEFVSPEHSLRTALARCERRTYAKSVFFSWTNLETASKKLAGLLTQFFPSQDGNSFLLDEVLRVACDEFEKSADRDGYTLRMAGFLKTLLEQAAAGVMVWETHGFTPDGESVAWVVGSMPIQEWMRKKNIERVVFNRRQTPPTEDEVAVAKVVLTAGLLTFNDAIHVDRLAKVTRT